MSRFALPTHCQLSLEEFLQFTSWVLRPGDSRAAMETALRFYQEQIPRHVLMERVARPSPWSLPRGNVIKLSELMQAVDFRYPVERLVLTRNRRFKGFRPPKERRAKRPKGNWFSELSARQETLGIPAGQQSVRVYKVKTPVPALKSRVSDAFTWIRKSIEDIREEKIPDKYFRGGGIQYFIWEADRYLELA